MKQILAFLLLLLPFPIVVAQECSQGRYVGPVFEAVDRTNAIPFGSNTGSNGTEQTLYLDVYEPAGDQLPLRPAVIVAFGGSFISGSRNDVSPICDEFAKRGHVAIAPDYRVGLFMPGSVSTMLAVMKGTHDLKASVRYLRKTIAEDGNPWRIDPDRIIIGGVSAGAIAALHVTYMNDSSEFPPNIAAFSDQIGGVEGNSGHPSYSSAVSACFSLSGAIGDTLLIDPGEVPLASVHDIGDQVVPYYTEEVEVLGTPTGLIASGSHDIHLRTENLGIDHCLLSYPGNSHVGYLVSDAATSMDFIFQFCANSVCGNEIYCGAVMVGLDETNVADAIHIHPNPANDQIKVETATAEVLRIYDGHGRLVLAENIPIGGEQVNIGHLPAGVYVLRLDNKPWMAQRLVVTHEQ